MNQKIGLETSVFSFLRNAVKPFKFYLGLHIFVVTYNAIDLSLWPYLSKLLMDKVATVPKENIFSEVWIEALLLIIFTILPNLVWRISDFSWAKMTPLMKKKITLESMNYITSHSHAFFQNNFSGALANKVRDLASSSPKIIEVMIYSFLNVALSLLIAFFALFSIHKFFAFGILLWAILFVITAIKGAKIVNPLSVEISNQQSKIMGNIVDVLSNIANLKFFPSRKFEEKRSKDFEDVYTKSYQKRGFFLLKFYTLQGFTFSAYFGFCIIALIWLYSKSMVTLGDFMMVFTINCFIINVMWMAANEIRTFLEDFGTVKQALEIINQPLEIKDGEKILNVTKGEIVFENVEFGYKNSKPIFAGKSVVIKPGQKVGLVGCSGGVKSTFVNLILRLFDVDQGRILIDGQNISEVTQDSLRNTIGVIPQDTSLFHRTLAENISYGNESASQLEIIEAAKNAHAHDFIMYLPQNYESLVGERGIKLSGGQRQRIAIARAFLKNAPILILDEATSQLDSITENFIQDSLQKLMENKTTIVVAHRISTLQAMDRILVFDSGKIVEDGSHQELTALNGFYKKLLDAQNGGVLTNQVEDAEAFLIFDFDKNNYGKK